MCGIHVISDGEADCIDAVVGIVVVGVLDG